MTTWLFRNLNRVELMVKSVNPDAGITFADPPAGPQGKRGVTTLGKGGVLTAMTKACKQPEKGAAFIEFLVASGRALLELGIEGIHFTRGADGSIFYNEEERAKDNFAPNGWAHPLAWGHVVWPITNMYLPATEPQRERAIESTVVSKRNQLPNLIPVVPQTEIELGSMLADIYDQYYIDMLMGKIDIDRGLAELSRRWRAQGGEKLTAEATEIYRKYR